MESAEDPGETWGLLSPVELDPFWKNPFTVSTLHLSLVLCRSVSLFPLTPSFFLFPHVSETPHLCEDGNVLGTFPETSTSPPSHRGLLRLPHTTPLGVSVPDRYQHTPHGTERIPPRYRAYWRDFHTVRQGNGHPVSFVT